MRILVNAANRMVGGAIAVTDSICSYLNKYPQHNFIVVLSPYCKHIGPKIQDYPNVKVYYYYERFTLKLILCHRDTYLDNLVDKQRIDVVFTVFESYWKPSKPSLAGFAQPHIIFRESPYFNKLSFHKRLQNNIIYGLKLWCIKKSCKHIYTENPEVSERLKKLIPDAMVYTVTSNYHQIYDQPEMWKGKKLPKFEGTTMLTIAAPYPSKNLSIIVDVTKELLRKYPVYKFRFVMTLEPEELEGYDVSLKKCFQFIGRVKIEECPSLYQQCDIMFMPTLLECFSATYPEAMRMKKAIVTTDLGFAKGVCGAAALYYSPLSAEEAADCIYKLANDKELYDKSVNLGIHQLKMFDNSEHRVSKLIGVLENLTN